VPVAVEGDRDRRVAHVARERLRVHAGGDHQARERMPALVQADGLAPLPGCLGATGERPGVDGCLG
jgi:hypothetical protein